MADANLTNVRMFARSFWDNTQGSMTVLGIFLFLASGILGAIALDVTAMYEKRTHLQVAADQAAHAALFNRTVLGKTDAEAKTAAIEIVNATLPLAKYGVTLEPGDIQFGEYVGSTRTFISDDDGTGAVRVTTSLTKARGNPASTFLFRLIGRDSFDIYASSTFATYHPRCLNEGFVANGIVDMQNQNFFGAGLCIHSNDEVQLQTNNEFQLGSTVSMPGGALTVNVPGDRIDDVEGLAAALADDHIDLRVLARIENMIYQYQNPNGNNFPNPGVSGNEIGWPSYITNKTPQDMGRVSEIDSSILTPGGVYIVDCTQQNQGLTINSGNGGSVEEVMEIVESTGNGNGKGRGNGNAGGGSGSTEPLPVLNEVIVITPCDVSFGEGSSVQNARIISLSESDSSFKAPSGLSLGSVGTDGCEADGAQLVSMGGMRFAANFSAYGSQIFSMSDIKFAATPSNSNDFMGVSMVADGSIDMASHVNALAGCGTAEAGDQIRAKYFRMVR